MPSTSTVTLAPWSDDAADAVALLDLDPRRRGEIDERGVELDPRRHRGVQAPARGSGSVDGTSGRRAQHDGVDRRERRDRGRFEPEVLELAKRERGQAVAAALVPWERRLVDDDDVASGPAQLDRRGHAGRTGPDDEDVDVGCRSAEVTSDRIRMARSPLLVRTTSPAMPLNPDAVGTVGDPVEVSWTSKDALLYAVGVGAGTDELAFTTENTANIAQRVLPTFPVVVGFGGAESVFGKIGSFNPAMLVHGQQSVTLHREIPVEGTGTITSTLAAMYDKGKAAVVVTESEAVSAKTMAGRAAVHDHDVGVHPRRRRLGRRPRPVRPAERPAGTRSRPRGDLPDVARPGARVPALGRSQPAALRPERSPRWAGSTARSCTACAATASPAEPCCTRVRLGPVAVRAHRGPVRVTGPARRSAHDRAWRTGDGEAVFNTTAGDRVVIDQGLLRHATGCAYGWPATDRCVVARRGGRRPRRRDVLALAGLAVLDLDDAVSRCRGRRRRSSARRSTRRP